MAIGLAVVGQIFVLLGALGVLNRWTIVAVVVAAIVVGARRIQRTDGIALLAVSPLALLALYPPLAFDETLYHLPFVRAIAESGAIALREDIRFPIFPQLHEALCVPAFLFVGDVATHLVATLELAALVGLMLVWPRTRIAGVLAAALVLGNPIVVHFATVTYVDVALTLFVAAGFFFLDRNPMWAGFLLGTACSVKYLGWYFAVAGAVYVLLFARQKIAMFLGAFTVAILPMYATIITFTGNPFFPFFGESTWTSSPKASFAMLPWSLTFAREHVNQQPPYSPLFVLSILATFVAAFRDKRAAFLSAVCVGYIAIFAFLPQDSRYLLPLLPLVSVVAVEMVTRLSSLANASIDTLGGWPLSRLCGRGWREAPGEGVPHRETRRPHPACSHLLPHAGEGPPARVIALNGGAARRSCARDDIFPIALAILSIAGTIAYAGYRFTRLGPIPTTQEARTEFLRQRIPEYRALERRGPGKIYVCGAEQLKYFGGDDLYGDVVGPWTIDKTDLTKFRYVLTSKRACPPEWQELPFERVYSDEAATLWRR